MYTTNMMVLLWDDTTVPWWVTVSASIVVLMVLYVLRINLVLQISDSLIQGNLLHVNFTNAFSLRPRVRINERCNLKMPTMRIPQNSNKFAHMVEQFTRWQREVDIYKTALENYRDANNVKINGL